MYDAPRTEQAPHLVRSQRAHSGPLDQVETAWLSQPRTSQASGWHTLCTPGHARSKTSVSPWQVGEGVPPADHEFDASAEFLIRDGAVCYPKTVLMVRFLPLMAPREKAGIEPQA